MTAEVSTYSREYILGRIQSLTGLWFVLFLCEHLFTNSQVALFFADDQMWFVRSVNFLHSLPYLQVIEIVLLGVPILFHAVLGIRIAITGKSIYASGDGTKPIIKSGRNRAFRWQKITAFILLIGIIAHVVNMRFMHYPTTTSYGSTHYYFTKVPIFSKLYSLSERLNVTLYSKVDLANVGTELKKVQAKIFELNKKEKQLYIEEEKYGAYMDEMNHLQKLLGSYKKKAALYQGLSDYQLNSDQVVVVADNTGTLMLINVASCFRSSINCILYTIFVASAAFHAFNGLGAAAMSWGILIRKSAQIKWFSICIGLMLLIGALGLMAIWGSYIYHYI